MDHPIVGRPLDRAVAERVFGYKVEGETVVTEVTRVGMPSGSVERLPGRQPLPHYSTSIADAYAAGRYLRTEVDQGRLPDEVWERFNRSVTEGGFWLMSNERAAELVCRSALSAIGGEGSTG